MRARKFAIFLALTAVSALTMFVVMLADSDAFGAESAPPLPGHTINLKHGTGPDGNSQVGVLVASEDGGSGDLRLPSVFRKTGDFTFPSGPNIAPHTPHQGMNPWSKKGYQGAAL